MEALTYIFIAALAGALLVALVYLVRVYLKFRGTRVVTCPETSRPAAVKVDARHAATTTGVGGARLRLADCSRWPERQDCGQDCLGQIEADPEGCLAWTMLTRWYAEKSCIYCQRQFGELEWLDRKPALMSPDGKMVEWSEVAPETLPDVLATHRPICWNCYTAESFRAEHPELIVERPWRWEDDRQADRR